MSSPRPAFSHKADLAFVRRVFIVVAVAAVGGAGYLIGRDSKETLDRQDFRENKTRQLLSTQATALEVLAKHAERERIAGKALPYTDEERALLRSLEDAQRAIVTERREPLPSPFEGAKSVAEIFKEAAGLVESLLPIALIGGALYLISRYGPPPEPRRPGAMQQ